MKQLQHSYYFWKTPRKNKTTCKNPLFLNDFPGDAANLLI